MLAPLFLKQGDKVAVVAPAKKFNVEDLEKGIKVLKKWGLEVETSELLYKAFHQFSASDLDRSKDLQNALDNPQIKAIFCARGGYGTARIIDHIDFRKFKKNPKWVCGFSDITVLTSHINTLNIQAVHSIMPTQFGKIAYKKSLETLKNLLFGNTISYSIKPSKYNKTGKAQGIIIGGNLTLIHCLLNTLSEPKWQDKILFIEEVGEHYYHLDRMLIHLKRTGKLALLAGVVVGHFSEMKDNTEAFGKTIEEIILDAVADYHYPVLFNFPAGHESTNMAIKLGAMVQITSSNTQPKLDYI